MKYNLLCFQTSSRLIIFFNKHDFQVSTSLMKQNKRYKGLKTAKWISIWDLVPGLFLTVRSAGYCAKQKISPGVSKTFIRYDLSLESGRTNDTGILLMLTPR